MAVCHGLAFSLLRGTAHKGGVSIVHGMQELLCKVHVVVVHDLLQTVALLDGLCQAGEVHPVRHCLPLHFLLNKLPIFANLSCFKSIFPVAFASTAIPVCVSHSAIFHEMTPPRAQVVVIMAINELLLVVWQLLIDISHVRLQGMMGPGKVRPSSPQKHAAEYDPPHPHPCLFSRVFGEPDMLSHQILCAAQRKAATVAVCGTCQGLAGYRVHLVKTLRQPVSHLKMRTSAIKGLANAQAACTQQDSSIDV